MFCEPTARGAGRLTCPLAGHRIYLGIVLITLAFLSAAAMSTLSRMATGVPPLMTLLPVVRYRTARVLITGIPERGGTRLSVLVFHGGEIRFSARFGTPVERGAAFHSAGSGFRFSVSADWVGVFSVMPDARAAMGPLLICGGGILSIVTGHAEGRGHTFGNGHSELRWKLPAGSMGASQPHRG